MRRNLIPILLFLLYVVLATLGAWFLAATAFVLAEFVLIAMGVTVLIVYLLVARLNTHHAAPNPEAPIQSGEKAASPVAGKLDEADRAAFSALIEEANQRLARSPKLANRRVKATVSNLPLFLIGGTEGAGKTSTFLKSGLEPELLAGQVFRDSSVVPTRLANLWFAEDALFAEISGTLFSGDPARWSGLLHQLHRRSAKGFFKRIFGGKAEAQLRGFILVCDITPFLGVPDPSRLGGLVRRMRERLLQVGEAFGTNFPVYVVLTRSDSIPYFSDYFGRLVENEDQQILGCTLPAVAPNARAVGEVYGEAETARLSEAFNQLYYSLADKRLVMLPRETDSTAKPGTYEFPREMKRIRDTLVQSLVDVFRPNPLQPGPILRGYYYTGTRQVTVSALGPAAGDPVLRSSAGEATSLFNLADYQKKMGLTPETPESPAETTMQRWCFVGELFHRVILPDPMGRATTFASSQQTTYKRIAFGAISGLALLLCLLWIRSWWNNSELLSAVEAASKTSYNFQSSGRAVPSLETLNGMEQLRTQLETLLEYDRNGPPWKMRWGLYAGGRVLASTHHLYFERFRQVFFGEIEGSFEQTLARLPSSPDAQNSYNATYDRVKAYRMITQCKCSPDPAFLSQVLSETWLSGRAIDDSRRILAEKQIAFYAAELKIENPYTIQENANLVTKGQRYLASIGGVDRLYRNIVEEANKSPRTSARLADLAPNYKQVLNSTPGEVKAAFTRRDGWSFVEDKIKDPSNTNIGDPCVVGARNLGAQLVQGPEIQGDLRTLYLRDYIRAWKDFASATTLAPFTSIADASAKLEILSSNRSPLLAAVFMIADNTNFPASQAAPAIPSAVMNKLPTGARKAMDVAKQMMASSQTATPGDVSRLFQPARAVISVDNPDSWINDPNQSYMARLDALRLAMQRLKDERPSHPDPSLNKEADDAVNAGLMQATAMAQKFNREGDDLKWLATLVDSDAHRDSIDIPLRKLLEAPFREAHRFIITDMGKADSQRAGAALKQLCTRLSAFEKKFPFNPSSEVDASIAEVTAVFAPQTGALANFQQQVNKFVTKQGKLWVANPAAQDTPPTSDFLRFMNRMQQIQDLLFADGSAQPKMHYALKPLPDQNVEAITLDIDGQKFTATKGQAEPQQLSWPGQPGQVIASVRASGDRAFGAYSSPWALWHWMYDADAHAPGSKTLAWSTTRQSHGQPQPAGTDAQGKAIVLRVELSEVPAGLDAFDRTFFDLRCPGKVAE